jgi:hypothetical protein
VTSSGGLATGSAVRAIEAFSRSMYWWTPTPMRCISASSIPGSAEHSSITNVTAGAYADIPLFAFHLLEYFEVDFELDVEEINARWRELAAVDQWSQMVIKETSPVVQMITSAAPTGQYS